VGNHSLADRQGELVQLVILNPATADETLVALAAKVQQREVDLIAQNEERLLRCPEIIGAMYANLKARMSTVDRAVELAVRSGIKVPGIPAWDEVVASLMGDKKKAEKARAAQEAQAGEAITAETDEAFAAAAEAAEEEEEGGDVPLTRMPVRAKIRLATFGNKFQRSILIRDSVKLVALAAIKAPGVTEAEAARYASNHAMAEDVISYIANRRDWTKLYGVKLSLITNPKTPIPAAIRFLPTLREKDLKAVARSKGISSAVAAQAKKRLMAKQRVGKR
jgi:hypothetical protein